MVLPIFSVSGTHDAEQYPQFAHGARIPAQFQTSLDNGLPL
jgi:hypothetical protein